MVSKPRDHLQLLLVAFSLGPDLRDEDRCEVLDIVEHLEHQHPTPVVTSNHPDVGVVLVNGRHHLVHPRWLNIVPGEPNIMLLPALVGHPGLGLRDSQVILQILLDFPRSASIVVAHCHQTINWIHSQEAAIEGLADRVLHPVCLVPELHPVPCEGRQVLPHIPTNDVHPIIHASFKHYRF